eukprot:UN07529
MKRIVKNTIGIVSSGVCEFWKKFKIHSLASS